MSIVAWVFLFYFISSLLTYTLIARGEQKKMIWINGIVAIINIIGNIIFIPYYSFIGSAWVTLASQFLLICITGWFVRQDISRRSMLTFAIPMFLVTGLAAFLSRLMSGS